MIIIPARPAEARSAPAPRESVPRYSIRLAQDPTKTMTANVEVEHEPPYSLYWLTAANWADADTQLWTTTFASGLNTFRFRNVAENRCMKSVPAAHYITLATCTLEAGEAWRLHAVGNGYWMMPGDVVECARMSVSGTVQLANCDSNDQREQWFPALQRIKEDVTSAIPLNLRLRRPTRLVATASRRSETGDVRAEYWWNTQNGSDFPFQEWNIFRTKDGNFSFYRSTDPFNVWCLGWSGPQHDYTVVTTPTCKPSTGPVPEWKLVERGGGYQIQSPAGLCLNAEGGSLPGTRLILYTCSSAGEDNDVWLTARSYFKN